MFEILVFERCLIAHICFYSNTYRIGHHSTSDDSSTYRTPDEVKYWKENFDPITRMKKYLINTRKLWNDDEDKKLIKSLRKNVGFQFILLTFCVSNFLSLY